MSRDSLISTGNADAFKLGDVSKSLSSNLLQNNIYDVIGDMLDNPGLSNLLKNVYAQVAQGKLNTYNSAFTIIGSLCSRNANPLIPSIYNAPYRPGLTAGITSAYHDITTATVTKWGNAGLEYQYLAGTKTQANSMVVDYFYPDIIEKALMDGITSIKYRELVPLQNNTILGGFADLSKSLIQGSWSKVQMRKLTPPIMPMVKLLDALIGATSAAQLIAGVNNLDGYDNLSNSLPTLPESNIIQGYLPSTVNQTSPTVYWQWMTVNQYIAMSINASYASGTIASLAIMQTAGAVGAHIFVPIVRAAISTGYDAAIYALGFSGFNCVVAPADVATANNSSWYPWSLTNAYDLPCGNVANNFYITFVVLDSVNTSAITAGGLTIPTAATGFQTSTFTTSQLQSRLYDSVTGGVNISRSLNRQSLLQMIKLCAGSQFPRVMVAAAMKAFRQVGAWYNSVTYDDAQSATVVTSAHIAAETAIMRSRVPIVEFQTTVTVTPTVNGVTMTLPYDPSDAIMWMMSYNCMLSPALLNIDGIAPLFFTIATAIKSRLVFNELCNDMILDYTWAGSAIEVNTLASNASMLYPRDVFALDVIVPTIGTIVYPFTSIFGYLNLLGQTRVYIPPRVNQLYANNVEREYFNTSGGKTKLKLLQGNHYVTYFDSAKRFPWNYLAIASNQTNLLVVLNSTSEYSYVQFPGNWITLATIGSSVDTNPYNSTGDEQLLTPRPLETEIFGSTSALAIDLHYTIPILRSTFEFNVGDTSEMMILDSSTLKKAVLSKYFRP